MPGAPRASGSRDYDPRDPQSILEFGRRVIGLSAREICSRSGMEDPSSRTGWKGTKNVLGDVMEWYFGIPKNNSPLPDFPSAKVELKIVPLKRLDRRVTVKEPTSISMIDYMQLLEERWESASVRKKLDRVLFVLFIINPGDLMASPVRDVLLWEPGIVDNAVFEIDWTRTWKMVADGRAHHLSESQAEALAARRKGTGGPGEKGREQPKSPEKAKSRAWSLKSSFTRQIFQERVLRRPYESAFEQSLAEVRASGLKSAEGRILASLRRFKGQPLERIAAETGVPIGNGKNLAATIIKRSLGFKNVNARIREFDQLGIDVKTLNLSATDGSPYEAVSFPVVELRALPDQDWEGVENEDGTVIKEGSDLADQLHRILFVPTFSTKRKGRQARRILGSAFFWSPSPAELETIVREWKMFQREVSEGKAKYYVPQGMKRRRNDLTPASRTEIIHMRPHGRNAEDAYSDPLGNMVTLQCFWLNKPFVWKLVKENKADPQPDELGVQ